MTILQPRLDALVQAARDAHSSALVILQHGEPLVNEILDGGGDRPIETMSVTKAVLSLPAARGMTARKRGTMSTGCGTAAEVG